MDALCKIMNKAASLPLLLSKMLKRGAAKSIPAIDITPRYRVMKKVTHNDSNCMRNFFTGIRITNYEEYYAFCCTLELQSEL